LAAGFGLAITSGMLTLGGLWGVPYLMAAYELPRTEAAGLMSLVFLGHGCGCVLLGWWSDTAKVRKIPMLVGASVCVTAQCVFLLVPGITPTALAIVVFVMGLGGASMVLPFALARESNDPRHAGLIIGTVNMAVVGGGAIFQPLVGFILDSRWTGALSEAGARIYTAADFSHALLVLPAVTVAGMVLVLLMRETHAEQSS
jgi:MFS family permease